MNHLENVQGTLNKKSDETKMASLKPGKTAQLSRIVNQYNTAKAVGSGSLDVFATPMMIALMEEAACACLSDGLAAELTSVGTKIEATHIAASFIGAKITATAIIDAILGHKIEFSVIAREGTKEIGRGKHTRVIVEIKRFLEVAEQKK